MLLLLRSFSFSKWAAKHNGSFVVVDYADHAGPARQKTTSPWQHHNNFDFRVWERPQLYFNLTATFPPSSQPLHFSLSFPPPLFLLSCGGGHRGCRTFKVPLLRTKSYQRLPRAWRRAGYSFVCLTNCQEFRFSG